MQVQTFKSLTMMFLTHLSASRNGFLMTTSHSLNLFSKFGSRSVSLSVAKSTRKSHFEMEICQKNNDLNEKMDQVFYKSTHSRAQKGWGQAAIVFYATQFLETFHQIVQFAQDQWRPVFANFGPLRHMKATAPPFPTPTHHTLVFRRVVW